MADDSVFRGVIQFFGEIGIYDVVLPFLLVFTIVFAIFEKTKILGTEGESKATKKNLNAMVAFVAGFLVIASSKIVAIINQTISQMFLLLLLIICFLLLIGAFYKESEEVALDGPWRTFFMFFMFIGILLIFLNALGWLDLLWEYLSGDWDTNIVGSIILFIIVVGFIWLVVREPKSGDDKKKDS